MRKYLLIALVFCFFLKTTAQEGTLDTSFNPTDVGFANGNNTNNIVRTTAIQTDGKVIIGGDFTAYNSITRNRIARLNADGSLDTTFDPGIGANGAIYVAIIQADGKIIIGGDFTAYNGISRSRIARLNTDGSLDTAFTGTGANGGIRAMAIQGDGKVIIGGGFTTYDGFIRNRIVRLETDGAIDETFNSGVGPNNTVYSIAIQTDGKIIIGGFFTAYNSTSKSYIARLNSDGILDTTFTGTGTDGTVFAIAIQADGKIIIGGDFFTYNGTTRNRIARLNSDGSVDSTFSPDAGPNDRVATIFIQTDNKIVIGGLFTKFKLNDSNRIARLYANGGLDDTFNPETGANDIVWSTTIQSDGKIIIGGAFTNFNGITKNRLSRLNANGSLDTTFDPGTGANAPVYVSAIQPDGKIVIGGDYTTYNTTARNRIARLNTDGSLDATFNPEAGLNGGIRAMAIQTDGKIIIGGGFYNYVNRQYIARLNTDGSLDTTFNSQASFGVRVITIQADGKIIIGGEFTNYNGSVRNRIARLNTDGSLDTTFTPNTGADSTVFTIAVQQDNKIIIGGAFATYNGIARNNIARLNSDGSLDTTFNPGAGPNSTVLSISIQFDEKIIIGGNFQNYNGTNRNRIARLNTDGSLDVTFNAGTTPGAGASGIVLATAIQTDGKIIIGGTFTTYNSISRNNLARLNANDGSLDGTFNAGGAASNSTVRTVAMQSNGKVVIGGEFTAYNGTGRNRVARINATTTLSTSSFDLASKLKCFPNPTKSQITIEANELTNVSLQIFDLNSRLLQKQKMDTVNTINIENLQAGVYLFKISSNEGATTERVVKN